VRKRGNVTKGPLTTGQMLKAEIKIQSRKQRLEKVESISIFQISHY
jgi:hypothetical protein